MYVVIFKAEIKRFDTEYENTAFRMRELATEEFGCTRFLTCSEGDTELSISYWQTQEAFDAWMQHPEHQAAQERARKRWYKSCNIEITELVRECGF